MNNKTQCSPALDSYWFITIALTADHKMEADAHSEEFILVLSEVGPDLRIGVPSRRKGEKGPR